MLSSCNSCMLCAHGPPVLKHQGWNIVRRFPRVISLPSQPTSVLQALIPAHWSAPHISLSSPVNRDKTSGWVLALFKTTRLPNEDKFEVITTIKILGDLGSQIKKKLQISPTYLLIYYLLVSARFTKIHGTQTPFLCIPSAQAYDIMYHTKPENTPWVFSAMLATARPQKFHRTLPAMKCCETATRPFLADFISIMFVETFTISWFTGKTHHWHAPFQNSRSQLVLSASSCCSCPSNFARSCRNMRSISAHFPLDENESGTEKFEVLIELLEPGRSKTAGRSPVAKGWGNAPKGLTNLLFGRCGIENGKTYPYCCLFDFWSSHHKRLRKNQSGQSKRPEWVTMKIENHHFSVKCVLAHGPSQQEPSFNTTSKVTKYNQDPSCWILQTHHDAM